MAETIILGIETSCDETAAALYCSKRGIIANVTYSQENHRFYGGVIPELASRGQLEKIVPVIQQAIGSAHITLSEISALAVTNKPGLAGSLLVGVCFAKAIAWVQDIPLLGINHLEGHAFSSLLENNVPFPHLCLSASGGHTALYKINGLGNYTELGHTLDDAAGEAFDKIAKIMGFAYPGGPIIEQLAYEIQFQDFFNYPRGTTPGLNFSFSGLKTAILYDLVKRKAYDLEQKLFLAHDNHLLKQQVASSLLVCIADIFCQKLASALENNPDVRAITMVGGVACNNYIKERLNNFCLKRKLQFFAPTKPYCTDNAAMIALVGSYKFEQGYRSDLTLDIFE